MRLLDEKNAVLMMVLDIDHFKQYNDTLGHRQGDEILRKVSQAVAANAPADSLTCRLGGDEFAVAFLGGKGEEQSLRERADAFWNAMRSGARAFGSEMTFSGGIAVSAAGMTYLTLFDQADRRLYKAKSAGRNCLISEND